MLDALILLSCDLILSIKGETGYDCRKQFWENEMVGDEDGCTY